MKSSAADVEKKTQLYDAMRAWGAVVSAFGTVIAVGALALGITQLIQTKEQIIQTNKQLMQTREQIIQAQDQWRKDVAINAIHRASVELPYTPRHCLKAGASLLIKDDTSQLTALHERQVIKLAKDQFELVNKCFADISSQQQAEIYAYKQEGNESDAAALTVKGSALLAQRLNYALDRDELTAIMINADLASRDILLARYESLLCEDFYPKFIEKLRESGVVKGLKGLNKFFKNGGHCSETAQLPNAAGG